MTDGNHYINSMAASREVAFAAFPITLPIGKTSGVFELGGSRT